MRTVKRSDLVVGEIYATITHPGVALTYHSKDKGSLFFTAPEGHPYHINKDGLVPFRINGIDFIMYPTPLEFMEIEERKEQGKKLLEEKRFAEMDPDKGQGQAELLIGSSMDPSEMKISSEAAAIIFLYQRDVIDIELMPLILAAHHKVFPEDAPDLIRFFQGNHPEVMMEVLKSAVKMMMMDLGDDDKKGLDPFGGRYRKKNDDEEKDR